MEMEVPIENSRFIGGGSEKSSFRTVRSSGSRMSPGPEEEDEDDSGGEGHNVRVVSRNLSGGHRGFNEDVSAKVSSSKGSSSRRRRMAREKGASGEKELAGRVPRQIKIALVGDSAVGKTSICRGLLAINEGTPGQSFSPKYHMTTGVDPLVRGIKIPNAHGQEDGINLILADSSGQDIYVEFLPKYWDKLDAVAVVFDITSQTSLTNAQAWLELAKGALLTSGSMSEEKYAGVLIGTKSDLEDRRTVSLKMAQEFAKQNNMQYFECSAKDGNGLDEPFYYLVHQFNLISPKSDKQ